MESYKWGKWQVTIGEGNTKRWVIPDTPFNYEELANLAGGRITGCVRNVSCVAPVDCFEVDVAFDEDLEGHAESLSRDRIKVPRIPGVYVARQFTEVISQVCSYLEGEPQCFINSTIRQYVVRLCPIKNSYTQLISKFEMKIDADRLAIANKLIQENVVETILNSDRTYTITSGLVSLDTT